MKARACFALCYVALLFTGCDKIEFKKLSGRSPVEAISITLRNGRPKELFVRVNSDVRIDSLVEMKYFEGLSEGMSVEVARQRLGEPHRVWTQPEMERPLALYSVPGGEVGFMSVPGSAGDIQHQVWALPTNQSPDSVILDASLREQLLPHLSGDRPIRVHVPRTGWSGAIILSMTSNRVDYLILGRRDGDPL